MREASTRTDVTPSVCTSAFQLAKAGLLKGLPATTHHDFRDEFRAKYPDIELKRGMRFVDGGRIATAACMEYSSDAWRG